MSSDSPLSPFIQRPCDVTCQSHCPSPCLEMLTPPLCLPHQHTHTHVEQICNRSHLRCSLYYSTAVPWLHTDAYLHTYIHFKNVILRCAIWLFSSFSAFTASSVPLCHALLRVHVVEKTDEASPSLIWGWMDERSRLYMRVRLRKTKQWPTRVQTNTGKRHKIWAIKAAQPCLWPYLS